MPTQTLKVGDMIIDFDQIHVVSKIEGDRIFYNPLIKDSTKGEITSSIPFTNFKKASLRILYTEKEIKAFIKNLSKEKPLEVPNTNNKNNNNYLKEYLFSNDPIITGKLLIYLVERKKTSLFSKSDQLIYNQALTHLSNEISVIRNISPDAAKRQILTAIGDK